MEDIKVRLKLTEAIMKAIRQGLTIDDIKSLHSTGHTGKSAWTMNHSRVNPSIADSFQRLAFQFFYALPGQPCRNLNSPISGSPGPGDNSTRLGGDEVVIL